ncbi:hypothetical protein GCM10023150_12880 [Kangiella taiwanensis]|uniref:Uncharacterized protein n=3 Tax=Kangiella taiwanensis TaxID=1079179 RepID=A0ABP8I195_9GAMM
MHLMLTKQKRLVSFCMFLVIVQFVNWAISPALRSHEIAIYIWYITWMITDILILLYVATRAVISGRVLKEEFAICVLTLVAISFSLGRYVERHFTEFNLVGNTQAYALQAVNFCIVMVLLIPILKQLVFLIGKQLNGITIFGLRFSVSSVRSSAVLANSKGLSKQKRRTL